MTQTYAHMNKIKIFKKKPSSENDIPLEKLVTGERFHNV
jgi:hypothetical protein